MSTKSKDKPVEDRPPNRAWLLSIAGILAVALAVVWWPGCRQYPPVTSREALQAIKLLYAACNTRDPARLKQVEKRLDALDRSGKLTQVERDAFAKIVELAHSGEWEKAEKAAFRYAQDQVGVGHPAVDSHDH